MEKASPPMNIEDSYQKDQKHDIHHGFNHESLWIQIRRLIKDVSDPREVKTEIVEFNSISMKEDKN